MVQAQQWQSIPTPLTLEQFEEFVLPDLKTGSRGPRPKLDLHTIFNYILKLLYLGGQWKELPIEQDADCLAEIHYTSIYRAFRRFEAQGCFDAIFVGSVSLLSQRGQLDISVIHGDETTTAAKKGGDNLGYSGHKQLKGDKVVAFCAPLRCVCGVRNCNVIAPFYFSPWESKRSGDVSRSSTRQSFRNGFRQLSECSHGKISSAIYCCASSESVSCTML